MSQFDEISRAAARYRLRFCVIGGHAVIAHGYPRQTVDLDLLARRAEQTQWNELLAGAGYTVFATHPVFTQFASPGPAQRPLDVMWANDETLEGIMAEAKEIVIGESRLWIPSVEHLLALKIHAVKHGAGHRRFKDMLDVIHLLDANGIDIRGDKFRKLCEKYGNEHVYRGLLVIAESA